MTGISVSSPAGLKNILVATDNSPASTRAIAYAGALACRFDAGLYALHAGEAINYAVPAQVWKEAAETSRIAAQDLGKTLRNTFPVVRSEVLQGEGPVWSAINNAIAEKKIDLLVLGTHGRTGLPRFLLGSVAEEVLRRASCPVLTLGPRAQSWDEKPLDRAEILYATDFSPEAYEAAPRAFAWASELAARLTLLHVIHDGPAFHFKDPMEPADAAQRMLERLLPEEAERKFPYRLQVEQGIPGEKIVEVAERLGAALIVTGARAVEGFPGAATHLATSTLHKVITRAPCAVLSAR